MNKLSESHCC